MNYLDKLKEKCNLNDEFMSIIYQIFDKLSSFGYISKKQQKLLEKKLYNNIDVVIFGNDIAIDYKSGYYDAIKKELYIKDINNIASIYLRILYALTTSEISKDTCSIGYSVASISKSNYKIIHNDFGINRAIVSNLACRLLYTLPTSLELMPTYRTYENDFLGNKVTSDNDIYFLEGKLLSQLCYILNVSEEDFYINLFLNPRRYLKKFFAKCKFNDSSELLNIFDETSRKYSNYNKLIYLNKSLDDNYINIKKNILIDSKKEELLKEQEKVKMAIRRALEALSINNDEDEFDNIESSLSEKTNEIEEIIKSNIIKIQNILVTTLFNNELNYSNIEYAIKLKKLEELLVIENQNVKNKVYEVISHKILNTFEHTASNLIEKIKYSLVNEIFASEKYSKIYKNMGFRKINSLTFEGGHSELVAVTIDDSFVQLVKIDHLNKKTKDLINNTSSIRIESLGYLLNNPSAKSDISYIEKIFTKIKNKFTEFSNSRIENMFICKVDNNKLVIIPTNDKFYIIQITENDNEINCKLLKLSEQYLIFTNNTNTNLPVLYNKNEGSLKKLLSLFAFFS